MKTINVLLESLKDLEKSEIVGDRNMALKDIIAKAEMVELEKLISLSLVENGKPIKRNLNILIGEGFKIDPKDVDETGWHTATLSTTKGYVEFQLESNDHAVLYRKSL